MGKTDCFTQFYPILPNWFYPLGKTTLPTLPLNIWNTKKIKSKLTNMYKLKHNWNGKTIKNFSTEDKSEK